MNMFRREGLQKSLFPEILFMKKNLDADERRLSLIFIFNYLRLSAEICVPKIIILKHRGHGWKSRKKRYQGMDLG